jgi:two-component system nitrate/nitrite response regulator NarL
MFFPRSADRFIMKTRPGTEKRIMVCSPHAILIAGFRALIAAPARLGLTECADFEDLRLCLAGDKPDLILIDLSSIESPASLAELRSLAPLSGLILWVDWISPEFIREAIAAGVRGILRRQASVSLCNECLDQVAAGKLWLEQDMNQRLLSTKPVRLSPRERQLVSLLTEGLRNKEIAGRMNITEGTAKAYLSRLFEKTGASDRFELALFALKNLETDPSAGPSRGPRIFAPLQAVFSRRA